MKRIALTLDAETGEWQLRPCPKHEAMWEEASRG